MDSEQNFKHQNQNPISKITRHPILQVSVIRSWSSEIIWDLVLEIWDLSSDPVVFSGVICYTRIKLRKRSEPEEFPKPFGF